MLHTSEAMYGEVNGREIGLKQRAQDIHEGTKYRKHF